MNDLLQTGGAGGVGALLGAVLSFFGLKSRLDNIEDRMNRLSDHVVFADTCQATHKAIEKKFEDQASLIREVRDDVKEILKKVG